MVVDHLDVVAIEIEHVRGEGCLDDSVTGSQPLALYSAAQTP
jgi:hypothetical protein